MKKFGNASDKTNAILRVFDTGEKLSGKDIVERMRRQGYNIKDAHLRMFIYYNMLYKYLKKEEIQGANRYSVI